MPVQVAMPYLEDEGRNRTISSYGQEYSPVYVENMKRYLGEKLGEIRRYNRGETDPLEMPIGYDVGPFAMIKGKDPQVVKILRDLMAEENRARGAMPKTEVDPGVYKLYQDRDFFQAALDRAKSQGGTGSIAERRLQETNKAIEAMEASAKPGIESKVLRGTWYRGQRTIPEPIATPEGNLMTSFRRGGVETTIPGPPVFSMARTSALKVGEPSGVSISAKPSVASGFAKWGEGEQELLQGARDEALDSVQSILEKHNAKSMYYNIADQINNPGYKSWKVTEDLDKIKASNPDDYNKLIEDIKGWSEINDRLNAGPPIARVMPMYGGVPEEKILRISNPEHQEVIKSSYEEALKKFLSEDPEAMSRITGYGGRPPTRSKFLEELRYDDALRKKFNDILSGTMQEKGYKGLLYTPQRYDEYELKMFDPKDIMALDVRRVDDPTLSKLFESGYDEPIGKGAKKLGEWTEASYGKPAHLKELYRDIDVDSILKNLYEARYEGKSMQELEKRPFKLGPSNKPDVEVIGPNDWQPGSYSEHVKELGKYIKDYLSTPSKVAAPDLNFDLGDLIPLSGEEAAEKLKKAVDFENFKPNYKEITAPHWDTAFDWIDPNQNLSVKNMAKAIEVMKKLGISEDNLPKEQGQWSVVKSIVNSVLANPKKTKPSKDYLKIYGVK